MRLPDVGGTMAVDVLGPDLRTLRKQRGLTLQRVADALSRSVGWVSQVERGISRPDPDDLTAIASLYEVPLDLISGDSATPPDERGRVVRCGRHKRIDGKAKGLHEVLLSPDLTDTFEVIRSEFAPRSEQPNPRRRATQELAVMIEGRLVIEVEGNRFTLGPGDSLRLRGEPYTWANPYRDPAVAVWVISPPVY
ncbi:MAG: helix-turn-helix domain-containing protein [Pseudomonadota bacterium]